MLHATLIFYGSSKRLLINFEKSNQELKHRIEMKLKELHLGKKKKIKCNF